jgi:hypothetical protein
VWMQWPPLRVPAVEGTWLLGVLLREGGREGGRGAHHIGEGAPPDEAVEALVVGDEHHRVVHTPSAARQQC